MVDLFSDAERAPAARLLTERDLVKTLSIPRTSLWRLRKAGLPTIKLGRSVRYDIDKVRAWLSNHEQTAEDGLVTFDQWEKDQGLEDAHWSLSVALDPKHRPQEPHRPSSTVRREWWRYPQEAHLFDRVRGRYRRLLASEIARLQGFPADWGVAAESDELRLIRGYGDAVPPLLSEVVFSQLPSLLGRKPKTAVEICAGFGGLALGERRALGLRHVALIERWDVACEVLRKSGEFKPQSVRQVDLSDVDWLEFQGRVDLLSGGPPCQPWSRAGKSLGAEDERDLLGSMPDVVAQVRPRGFVFENVPGLLSGEHEDYAHKLVQRLRDSGGVDTYGVAIGVLNAADFGVAQTRRRVFIVGAKGKTSADVHDFFDRVFACRTHADPRVSASLGLSPWRKIADAIDDWDKSSSLVRWRRWPVPVAIEEQGAEMDVVEQGPLVSSTRDASGKVRIGLDWPSRGCAVRWSDSGWTTLTEPDTGGSARGLPLLPSYEGKGDPLSDPWLVLGDPCIALDAVRRQLGRQTKLVYLDLPRIKTNAGAFDAAERESVLNTWLSVTRALLRRGIGLLADGGAIAVLCGIEETAYAKLLMDELAGNQNYLGTVAWQKGYSPRNMPNMRELSPIHDNILLYARRLESLAPLSLRIPAKGFKNSDNDPRGPWKAEQKGANKPDCDYSIHVCPYRWSIVGGELPPGIWRINPKTGVIWGQPREAGHWKFTIRVEDRIGKSAERALEIEVSPDCVPPPAASIPWLIADVDEKGNFLGGPDKKGPLRIRSTTLPVARLGATYSACVLASGGEPWLGTTRPGKTSSGGKGRYWEFPASTLLARAAEDAVDFKAKDDAIPALKVYATSEDGRLNQTSVWFGRTRKSESSSDGSDALSVDYSQDAKKELEALLSAGSISGTVAASKPSRLMCRLMALFTGENDTVVDLGSPAAEMAAIATATGRKAIYVTVPPDEDAATRVWLPRLRLASRGAHPLPSGIIFSQDRNEGVTSGYIMDGKPRPENNAAGVFVLRPGRPFAAVDLALGSVLVEYEHYKSGSAEFLAALASVEGLVPIAAEWGFATSRDSRVFAIYLAPREWLDATVVERIDEKFASHIMQGGRVRVYYHRGAGDPDRLSRGGIELRRIPFSLTLAAGLA
jgi:site-specific DNA-cytosine methylase